MHVQSGTTKTETLVKSYFIYIYIYIGLLWDFKLGFV